ncbi:CoA transferase [Gordonia sp. PKS22-38]|uniref:CoA transferase n=1 Tax=Gordonia prachuapensis TaxID=3115651 RepID=A0ABU7MTN5_9ACTN|nr:CoA transferase [Gordonia sp. PKS22-38]
MRRNRNDAAAIVDRWLAPWPTLPHATGREPSCPMLAWAACGGMALTGFTDEAPVLSPSAAIGVLAQSLHRLRDLTGSCGTPVDLDVGTVIGARAALRGFHRQGDVSAGGLTRLLRAGDGWIALALPRDDDVASVPAIIGDTGTGDPWHDVTEFATRTAARDVVDRAQLLGVASAVVPPPGMMTDAAPFEVSRIAEPATDLSLTGATVVDFSSLWAGPLCGHILTRAGAQVIKVESTSRPDGARVGDPDFFAWLHRDQQFLRIDFASTSGRAELADHVAAADIVIEASRPRALENLGVAPHQVTHRPGRIWVSITGGGRSRPMQVDFGDDAAAGGGLVGWTDRGPVFCADAIADPLSGVSAALAVAASARSGGGHLIDVSMTNTAAAFAAAENDCPGEHHVITDGPDWSVSCSFEDNTQPVLAPRPPTPPH